MLLCSAGNSRLFKKLTTAQRSIEHLRDWQMMTLCYMCLATKEAQLALNRENLLQAMGAGSNKRSQAALMREVKEMVDSAGKKEAGTDEEKKKELSVAHPQMATMYLQIKHHNKPEKGFRKGSGS